MSKSKYLEEIRKLLDELLEGVDREKLKEGDAEELTKFRFNISRRMQELIFAPLSKKVKILQIFEAAAFELIAQIPVITPVITAVLQTVTGKDLASKMDKMLERQDKMLELQNKILERQDKILERQDKILERQDKMLELQNKILERQDKMLELQNKILERQDKMLELQNKTIDILDKRLPPS